MRCLQLFFLLLPISLTAQTQPKVRVNSFGLFAETNGILGNADNGSISTVGLQYVRKKEKKPAYTVSLGYTTYTSGRPSVMQTLVTRDTAESRWNSDRIDMLMLGVGMELQKQFYRKLHFFSGLQLRAGYGNGARDTIQEKTYNYYQYNTATKRYERTTEHATRTLGSTDITMLYFGFTPYFGLKLDFKRFVIGTSFMNYVTFRSLNDGGHTDGMVDFSINDISQQFFVRYKI